MGYGLERTSQGSSDPSTPPFPLLPLSFTSEAAPVVKLPPQPPTFEYYQELEVEPTASLEHITYSYRRLACVNHLDRNFGHEEQATIKLQRLQQAFKTLSDPIKRDRYDNLPSNNDEDGDDYYDYEDSPEFFPYPLDFGSGFGRFPGGFQQHYSRARSWWEEFEREKERREQRAREREAEYREQYEERRRKLVQQYAWRCKREVELKAKREVSRAAKEAAVDCLVAAKERLKEKAKLTQEQRWKDMNAVTKEKRLRTCLHSDYCAKVEQKRKVKCAACPAKRGLIAFECPHCSVFLCQLCVGNFSTRRQKLASAKDSVFLLPRNPLGSSGPHQPLMRTALPEQNRNSASHNKELLKYHFKRKRARPRRARRRRSRPRRTNEPPTHLSYLKLICPHRCRALRQPRQPQVLMTSYRVPLPRQAKTCQLAASTSYPKHSGLRYLGSQANLTRASRLLTTNRLPNLPHLG